MTEPRDTKPCDGACPGGEAFIAAFMNEARLENKDRLLTHVMICPRCRKKFQAMRQVRSELKDMDLPSAPPAAKLSSFRFIRKLVAVGGAVVFFLAALFFFLEHKRGVDYRGNGSGRLVLVEPRGGILEDSPSLFKWTPLRNADRYNLTLIDEELNTVYRTGGAKNTMPLPEDVRAKLIRGKTYIWTVEARDDDGRPMDSASSSFELKQKP